jgi:hypothetical protein
MKQKITDERLEEKKLPISRRHIVLKSQHGNFKKPTDRI